MVEFLIKFADELAPLIPPFSLSIFGGLTGYIIKKNEERSLKQLFADLIVAIFVGMIVHFALQNYDFSNSWKAVYVAMSACMAREVLLIFSNKFLKTINTTLGSEKEKDDNKKNKDKDDKKEKKNE